MLEVTKLTNEVVTIGECDHIDVNVNASTNLDVNINSCEHLTLRIKDPKSNFRVELNGTAYCLNDAGDHLVMVG